MKPVLTGLLLLLSLMVAERALADDPPAHFQMPSTAVGCTYEIEVVVPSTGPVPENGYPVAYCLDWFILDDYLKSLPRLMAMGRLTEPFVLVGIAQGSTMGDWATARTRDFTPAPVKDEYSRRYMVPDAVHLTGGAGAFLRFLEEELLPRIEGAYPVDPSRRCVLGYSLGGLLGVHALIESPGLFQSYVLGSPSLWFNEFSLSFALEALTPEQLEPITKVYLSVGEEEDREMLKGFDLLRSALHRHDLPGLGVKAEILEEAGHVGAMPISLYNGLRFVFREEQ